MAQWQYAVTKYLVTITQGGSYSSEVTVTRLKIRHCDQKTNSYIYIYFSSFYIWLFVKSAKRMMAWLAYAIESPENIKLLPDKLYVAMWYTVSAQIRGHSWLDRHYFKILIGRHFFWQKVPFSRLLGQNCNRPPPYNPNLFISLRPLICADRVCLRHLLIIDHFFCQYLHFEIQIITEWGYRWLLYMPFYCLFNLLPVNSKLQKFTIGNETVNGKSKLLILLSKSSWNTLIKGFRWLCIN